MNHTDNEHVGDLTLLEYTDPEEHFTGYLAMENSGKPLAAGGFRVQRGLCSRTIVGLAKTMGRKQRVLGLHVDGAKCGLDYDPTSPRKHDAMRRFLAFLRPHLMTRYSMGPDMATSWAEIEHLCRLEQIPSPKIAVAKAQGMQQEEYFARIALLRQLVGPWTLGQRRAGHGLAHCALAALDQCGIPRRGARVAIQGFGALGRGAALTLHEAGVSVTTISEIGTCIQDASGLEIPALVECDLGSLVAYGNAPAHTLFELPVDVLVLAAKENAISQAEAERVDAQIVVAGANLALLSTAELVLTDRGIVVVPDFVAGAGGSASMNALFGPATRPTAAEVLEVTGSALGRLVVRILDDAQQKHWTARQAALSLCEQVVPPRAHPYGESQGLSTYPDAVAREDGAHVYK